LKIDLLSLKKQKTFPKRKGFNYFFID